ncbi:hypothetical protein K7432_007907 [Basidiobolus ranarum]|uniref:Homeobox domain-containing protein n=1 Tax=Basidiobolus ranarum TaxID=34480 RepID=A0ABR2WSR3_9FUNG
MTKFNHHLPEFLLDNPQLSIDTASEIKTIDSIKNRNSKESMKFQMEDTDREIKRRNRLNPQQVNRLMQVFEQTTKPRTEVRRTLAKELGMHQRAVQIWFQNRRQKLKKEQQGNFLVESSYLLRECTFNSDEAVHNPFSLSSSSFEHSNSPHCPSTPLSFHQSPSFHFHDRSSTSPVNNSRLSDGGEYALSIGSSVDSVDYNCSLNLEVALKGRPSDYGTDHLEKPSYGFTHNYSNTAELNTFTCSASYSQYSDYSGYNAYPRDHIMSHYMSNKESIQSERSAASNTLYFLSPEHQQKNEGVVPITYECQQESQRSSLFCSPEMRGSSISSTGSIPSGILEDRLKMKPCLEDATNLVPLSSVKRKASDMNSSLIDGNLQDMLAFL